MSKISIDGHIIGTDAEKVVYGKNNAATVEDALDALFEGAGSSDDDEISNADLAMLADKLLTKSGIVSAAYLTRYYVDSKATTQVGGSFDPSKLNGQSDYGNTYACHFVIDIYEGDVLHYDGIGFYNEDYWGYVICDAGNKVLATGGQIINGQRATGTATAPAGSRYVYITSIQGYKPRVWVETNRHRIKKPVDVIVSFGDSITTDSVEGNRPHCYPILLAKMFGAEVNRISLSGASINHLGASIPRSRVDADVVTIMYGANDANQIKDGDTMGTASSALSIFPANYTTSQLTAENITSLEQSHIGRYRLYLGQLLEHLVKEDSVIFCIGPTAALGAIGAYVTALNAFREEVKALVEGLNLERVRYIDGSVLLSVDSFHYYDTMHLNQNGQEMLADGLYPYILHTRLRGLSSNYD